MTIDELIAELQRRRDLHGGNTEVEVTWEGITRPIELANVYLSDGNLYIDADDNTYKAQFQDPADRVNDPAPGPKGG